MRHIWFALSGAAFFAVLGPFFPFALTFVGEDANPLGVALLLYPLTLAFGLPVAALTGLIFGIVLSLVSVRFRDFPPRKRSAAWLGSGALVGAALGFAWCFYAAISETIRLAAANLPNVSLSDIFLRAFLQPANLYLFFWPTLICGVLFALLGFFLEDRWKKQPARNP